MAPCNVPCRTERSVHARNSRTQQNPVPFRGYVYMEIAEGPGVGSKKTERSAAFLGSVCL